MTARRNKVTQNNALQIGKKITDNVDRHGNYAKTNASSTTDQKLSFSKVHKKRD